MNKIVALTLTASIVLASLTGCAAKDAQQKEIAVMTAAVRSASAEGCQYYGKRP